MNQSGLKDSPAACGSPAFTQANLPNRTNAIHPVPPKRIRSDTFTYPVAAIQRNNYERRHNSHSQLNNNGCISSNRPRNSHFSTPGTNSSIRFQQQRSILLTPPYHLEEHVGHNFRTPSNAEPSFRTPTHIGHSFRNPNQLFSSPVRINTGRQSLGNQLFSSPVRSNTGRQSLGNQLFSSPVRSNTGRQSLGNQLFSSPVRINTGRQSLGHAYDTQSSRFYKSSNPGANGHRENYYHPGMVTDPWQFCQPVIRS